MENSTSLVDQPRPELLSSIHSRVLEMIQKSVNDIKNDFRESPGDYEEVMDFARNCHVSENMSPEEFEEFLEELFAIEGHQNLRDDHHKEQALRMEREKLANAKSRADHTRACEVQGNSALLRLPREIRDTTWKDVVSGSIVHVSRDLDSSSYSYHSCIAPRGLMSSACHPGEGDHAPCATNGPSDFPSYRLICKQINLELPDPRRTFFSKSAFHFDNLEDTRDYLFALKKSDRAAINHLRLPIPYSLPQQHRRSGPVFEAWEAIMNYFSCPWVRETLNLDSSKDSDERYIQEPWYFYYSSCYYRNNRDRMYKKWQIGFGNTSWDMDIASLRYKGEPKIDIGMSYAESAQSIFENHHYNRGAMPFTTNFADPPDWLRSLLQFRQYSGLNFHFWDASGVRCVPRYEAFIKALHEQVSHSEIGPWKLVEFRGIPFGNPDRHSLRGL
ncbi:hypothetical protein EYC80_003319 [Monilinia laxa]|uniref:Uncharacterized protein n=1 Tax=Monilinia laxa TaxID=61186 RepID=A0A5N6KDK9_MONLA|nr:hypothetical protein EYC80_003319 [Monilinia laxa]